MKGATTSRSGLADGRVLVSGGQFLGSPGEDGKRSIEVLSSTEIYDPATGSWSPAADMTSPQQRHSGVLLRDGRVFAAGGDSGGALASAEIYDTCLRHMGSCNSDGQRALLPRSLLPAGRRRAGDGRSGRHG